MSRTPTLRCRRCRRRYPPTDEFWRRGVGRDGLYRPTCRECISRARRAYRRRAGPRYDYVPAAPVREAVLAARERRGLGWSAIALAAGWPDRRGGGDATTLKRRLGMIPHTGTGAGTFTVRMRAETARRILAAVGVAPVDIGL